MCIEELGSFKGKTPLEYSIVISLCITFICMIYIHGSKFIHTCLNIVNYFSVKLSLKHSESCPLQHFICGLLPVALSHLVNAKTGEVTVLEKVMSSPSLCFIPLLKKKVCTLWCRFSQFPAMLCELFWYPR